MSELSRELWYALQVRFVAGGDWADTKYNSSFEDMDEATAEADRRGKVDPKRVWRVVRKTLITESLA
jgi:hypothetical protein